MHKPEQFKAQILDQEVLAKSGHRRMLLCSQRPKLGNLFDKADCSRGANASENLFYFKLMQ